MWLLRKPADGVQAKPSLLQPQVLAQGILKRTEIFLKEMRISIPTRGLKEKNDHHMNNDDRKKDKKWGRERSRKGSWRGGEANEKIAITPHLL